jgi:GT2 family glycosyltransferase/ubiquinone/menaquinone biosynthesis C-methylase UbiE/glycosyltransferase involved in cell wall biosynthesis
VALVFTQSRNARVLPIRPCLVASLPQPEDRIDVAAQDPSRTAKTPAAAIEDRAEDENGMSSDNDSQSRRIEWTGERCVPWSDDLQVIYEHYQRYLFVAPLAHGQRVLELASGEGYGTAILASEAQSVLGIDIDEDSVLHATETYLSSNISFQLGDMLDLSSLEDGSFDLVVCFEALEHVDDHKALLDGVIRVLAPGGTFVVSTPDRLTYTEELGQNNPFHVHELSRDEFEQLLGGRFQHVQMWGQNVSVGSLMMPLDLGEGSGQIVVLKHEDDQWTAGTKLDPTYLVAIASDAPLAQLPLYSTLIDPDLELIRETMRQRNETQNALNESLEMAKQRAELFAAESKRRNRLELQLREQIVTTTNELTHLTNHLNVLEEHAAHLDIHRLHFMGELETLQASRAYRIGQRVYGAVERLLPIGSPRRNLIAQLMRPVRLIVGRPLAETPMAISTIDPAPWRPLFLPTSTEPLVSIVIPVHDGWALTHACLRSLAAESSKVPFEVIVVDDASTDETRRCLESVDGIRVLHLDSNRGFLHAVNTGAGCAGGDFLLLLNNDVEVQPGWLDALVATAESDSNIGIVGARLVYPDGLLQEAGGIIWSDATGWNYGRYQDSKNPSFSFRRDVDFCSGACLLVRNDLWQKVGGFDAQFAPAYYEDADLAFSARALGYRVVYEPKSVVIHKEGSSYGTDASTTKTSLMEINRKAFQEKWTAALLHHVPRDEARVRVASWRRPAGHALVVDHLTPTFDQDAGSLRMFELLRMLINLDYAVTFVPNNGADVPRYTEALEELGVEVLHGPIHVPTLIAELAPDLRVAILSRPQVAWNILPALREFAPNTKIIYDTVDLHFLRERRRAEIENDGTASPNAKRYYEMELSLVRMADSVFVVSEVERAVLAAEAPQAPIYVIPTIHQSEHPGLTFDEREGLLFVGSFNHPPNCDAAEWLKWEILPIVRRSLPDIPIYIVGSNPTGKINALAGDGVEILGWVPDLHPLYARTRLFVAPLRYGAGIRGKIGESAAHGLPVVSTSLGAEGLKLRPELEILIADDAEAFAETIVRVYTNPTLWWNLATNSREAIALQCSPLVVQGELARALKDLSQG